MAAKQMLAVQPDATETDERAKLLEEIACLQAQIAAAPQARPVPVVAPRPVRQGKDPYGPFQVPRMMHGVRVRSPIDQGGKLYHPGATYTKLTCDEVHDIKHRISTACWLLKHKDEGGEAIMNLGEIHTDA